MIVLDTHIWVWWVHGDVKLPADYLAVLQKEEEQGFGISAISCWEIAKLVQGSRLEALLDLRGLTSDTQS